MIDWASSAVAAEAAGVMGVTALSFLSTNLDNLVVLSAYGSRPGLKAHLVRATFLLVCLAVLVVSFLLARAAQGLQPHYVNYLGVIPLGIGLVHLARLLLGWHEEEPDGADAVPASGGAYLGLGSMLLANSGDSVGVLTPLLSDLKPVFVLAGFGGALAAAVLLALAAMVPARHPVSKAWLEKFAKWGLPFLMILIGVTILTDAGSDVRIDESNFGAALLVPGVATPWRSIC